MIREAVPVDIPAIGDLEDELFGAEAWASESLLDELQTPGRVLFVFADEDDEVLGYAITMLAGDVVDLERIGVRADSQRRGVAGQLLDSALDQARRDGADRMLLEVSSVNHEALGFYAGADFRQIDVRARYYRDGSDALVMARSLGPSCNWSS
ncbi:MAG: GNAT family N-acetyltransferase [Nocardioides sp.]|nr:GNAT family N-acetyltransferase [Nocardioides sp.]